MEENRYLWVGGKQTVNSILELNKDDIIDCVSSNDLITKSNIIKVTSKKKINEIFKNKNFNHQGIAAKIKLKKKLTINDFIEKKILNGVMLDSVTDIGNVGAIIRSCIAFNINFIILEKNILQGNLENIYKTSSGMAHQINFVTVTNLNNAVKSLKKNNYWITGMDGNADSLLKNSQWFNKNIIIFGSEGKGIKKTLKESCDQLMKINIQKKSKSINVSNACAITLYNLNNKN